MKELSWDNESDRLEIVKDLYDKSKVAPEYVYDVLEKIPWLIDRVEELERENKNITSAYRESRKQLIDFAEFHDKKIESITKGKK